MSRGKWVRVLRWDAQRLEVRDPLPQREHLQSIGKGKDAQKVSSNEEKRNEQGKSVQKQLIAWIDERLKKFCSNGGNKEFMMDKMNLDDMGYAVHTSHGIKHQKGKPPMAVLSYHIVVNALCMLWETRNGEIVQKKFWKSLGVNAKNLEGFDVSIYSAGRCWRTINNTKPHAEDKRTFIPTTLPNEIACHIAQAIHPSATEIVMRRVADKLPTKSPAAAASSSALDSKDSSARTQRN